jgi:hypothetical protein
MPRRSSLCFADHCRAIARDGEGFTKWPWVSGIKESEPGHGAPVPAKGFKGATADRTLPAAMAPDLRASVFQNGFLSCAAMKQRNKPSAEKQGHRADGIGTGPPKRDDRRTDRQKNASQ